MTNIENDQRGSFSAWMRKQRKSSGEKYSDATINQYCVPLANAVPKLSLSSKVRSNLFEYTSVDEFESAVKVLRNAPNFSEIDRKNGNGAFSAALPLYHRFLQEAQGTIVASTSELNEGDLFQWIPFYEALADKLMVYKDNRHDLYEHIYKLSSEQPLMNYLHFDDHPEWWPTKETDPFTVIGTFNRGNITDSNRTQLAKVLADAFGVTAPLPTHFSGIPVLNYQNAFFNNGGINELWDLYLAAIELADNNGSTSEFRRAFNAAVALKNNKWNITMALFWIRPNNFMPLETRSRQYLQSNFDITVQQSGGCCSADEYINVLEQIRNKFNDEKSPVHSFAELSYAAWSDKPGIVNQPEKEFNPAISNENSYTKADFLEEVYLSEEQYDILSGLLQHKKNIILQGAPGVGKTYAAKRLVYSIMGEKDDNRIRMVQFHQSYSYEDFVLGYRPDENGFSLETGLFYDFCITATSDPDRDYYFIIDEVNRGNLSKIFGELLMLIESDKRGPAYSVQLAYHSDKLDRRFYVPENLYIIGMMNTADRSLATLDYALRRRFAFFTMQPNFHGIKNQSTALAKVITEVEVINTELIKERGNGFQIGHSYFIGKNNAAVSDDKLRSIVEFELIPLLQEYYFDDETRLNGAMLKLRNALQ